MKRNRKISKKMNVNVMVATHMGSVLLAVFVMVIVNLLASSSCQQLSKSIGENEKALSRLEDTYNRETTRWEAMKTTDKIEAALLRRGLSMKPPHARQNVIMRADGRLGSQYSVAVANRRNGGRAAQYKQGR